LHAEVWRDEAARGDGAFLTDEVSDWEDTAGGFERGEASGKRFLRRGWGQSDQGVFAIRIAKDCLV
jgi:hypothetical protein